MVELERLEAQIVDSIARSYFYLFLIFTAGIGLLTCALWRMRRALKLSRARENYSSAFSRQIVLAQEKEKSRIARDLHDNIAQDLRYVSLKVSQLGRGMSGEAREICRDVESLQRELIGKIRGVCDGLVPPDLRRQGLADSLRSLCRNFSLRAGIPCRMTIQENLALDPLAEEGLLQCYRIVQESLVNIERHARAEEAIVVLRNSLLPGGGASLIVCVSDDGKGFKEPVEAGPFTPSGDSSGVFRLGIRGMYERAAILGGSLNFLSAPGEGTMVRLEVPL
jgi:signal transduction histidine kinase